MLLTSSAYGRRVGLRFDPDCRAAVQEFLPFWWTDVDVEPQQIWDVASPAVAEHSIRAMELWVAEHAVDRVFVHAGVVAVDGRALLLPGRSFTGKTTLVEALLRAGADYLSDEYAVIDADGLVHAYPRALSIRRDKGRHHVLAEKLGAHTVIDALPVRAVVSAVYEAGRPTRFRAMSQAETVLTLLDNAVAAKSRSVEVTDSLICAVRTIDAVRGNRGEAESAATMILDFVRKDVAG